MGGTLNNVHNNTSFALNLHYEAMARLQEQAYTGSRINRASDDPSAAYRILGLNSQKRQMTNYMDNISYITGILDTSLSVFAGYGDETGIMQVIAKTKVLLTTATGTSGQVGEDLRKQGIKDYLDEIISLANWKREGQYLFGGSNTSSTPYTVTRDSNGNVTSVTYQGSSLERNVEVAPGVQSSAFYAGDDIFRCHDRGDSEFVLGHTGAAVGTGTSSVTGYTWLNVTYNDISGHYELYIDDADNPVDVDPAEDITNIAVTNLAGQVLYVNAEEISSTGVELVSNTGTHDIFNTLITISQIFENENNFTSEQLKTMRNNAYDATEKLSGRLLQTSTSMGMKIGFFETLKNNLDNIKLNTEDETTILQEADIAQIAIDLSRREILYQMSLSVAAKLMSMSLLDFIR